MIELEGILAVCIVLMCLCLVWFGYRITQLEIAQDENRFWHIRAKIRELAKDEINRPMVKE